jgi:hypothetical protein
MNNYTKVANQVLEDATLSLKAKGLFAYLVKLPKDWKIRIGEIAKHHKDGYDSVQSALNELRQAGYLERLGRSRDKGKVGDWDYRINTDLAPDREKPSQENPDQVEPDRENPVQVDSPLDQIESAIEPDRENPNATPPDREKPDKENPRVYIKDLQSIINTPLTPQGETTKLSKKSKKASAATLPPLPDWLPKDLWSDFVEHRRLMRKPLTPLAATRVMKTLNKVATKFSEAEARQCLDVAIMNGWSGVFEPKQAATPQRYQSVDERNQSVLDDFLKGDADGKPGNDSQSPEELGGQHWADYFQRPSLRVV